MQNAAMKQLGKWLVLSLLAAMLLLGAGLFGLQHWVGTDDFRARVQVQAGDALGVPVQLGRIAVDLWPVPAVALLDAQVQTVPDLFAERVEVRLVLGGLLAGRLDLATLLVRRADLPQAGIDQLMASFKKKPAAGADAPEAGAKSAPPDLIPRRLVLDAVTWRSAGGIATTVEADIRLSPEGLPDALSLKVLAGQFQGAGLQLARKESVWDIKIDHAGGTIQGSVERQDAGAGKDIALKGRLETKGVEISAVGGNHRAAAGRLSGAAVPAQMAASPLTGRLDATTLFDTRAANVAGLLDALQTQSRFSVRNAVLHGIDLARAVQSIGLSRGGETRLDTLAGQLNSRGKAITLSNLVASSGVLSASGNVAMAANRALSGRVHVSLGAAALGNTVGVPLVVGGTLDAPTVTLTRAAMVGAAIGTMVMPGLGTGAGASMGDKLGEKLKGLFGK